MAYFIFLSLSLFSSLAQAASSTIPSVLNSGELFKLGGALLLVLCIIVLLSWAIKRVHGVQLGSSKGFQSIAHMSLGPKEKIQLLQVGDRYLLIGCGGGSLTLLHDFGDKLPQGFEQGSKPVFAELLKSVMRKS